MPKERSIPPFLFVEQPDLMDHRPKTIQRSTAFWINSYLADQSLFHAGRDEYLKTYTLPFIQKIRDGLSYFQLLGKITNKKYLNSIIAKGSPKLPESADYNAGEAMEAFDFALATFGYLPRHHTIQVGNNSFGYSLRGNLRPPQTTDEFLWRTYELYSLITGVIDSSVPQGRDINAREDLMRPTAFFLTGQNMPLREPASFDAPNLL